MKKHPFQKGIEKSNEELIDTSLGHYRHSKEKSIPPKGTKAKKPGSAPTEIKQSS